MTSTSLSVAAVAAAPLSVASGSADKAGAIVRAAQHLLLHLERGQRIDAPVLRTAMESAFGASDADGGWDWKTAYDACEAATVLFVRKFGPAMRARAASPAAMLPMLAKIAGLLPTHTRRSEESEALQQFSTPIMLGLAASAAAAITPDDIVLEPSAGTGLLAILAELSGASLVLNELAETRAELLSLLFPGIAVTRFDAAHIDDHLDTGIAPSVVLMNPPFSAIANVDRRMADAALRHIASALARLPEGGRLVAITGASCSPDNPVWRDAFVRLQERGRVVFTRRHCRRGLRQARHHHRDAPDRDRSVARGRCDGISVVSWRGAGRCHAAWLGHGVRSSAVADRDGRCRSADRTSGHSANGPRLCHAPVRHRGSGIGSRGGRARL